MTFKTPAQTFICFSLFVFMFASCNKNKDFSGDTTLSGYAYLADSIDNALQKPLALQTLYLNNGNDTTTYISQINADLAGSFSIPSLKDKASYILFAKFIKDGIEYTGATKVEGSSVNGTIKTTLYVYPHYMNGMIVTFKDSTGGLFSHLPFRIYLSKLTASFDSTKYAISDTVSDSYGQYRRFNLTPATYFFVSKDSFSTSSLKIFDSVIVPALGVEKRTIVLN